MILHKELKQRSLEWHELRHGKIGGTSSKELIKNDKFHVFLRESPSNLLPRNLQHEWRNFFFRILLNNSLHNYKNK